MESMNTSGIYELMMLGTMGASMLFPLIVLGICLLLTLALQIIFGIPYYKMAKNAGLSHAWLAFIPIGCYYIMLNLPAREFNIFNWIKTDDRNKVFTYYLLSFLVPVALAVLAVIPGINLIIGLISPIISTAYSVAVYIFMWRVNYDILMTYGMEEHAMWASIVSCFCPLVMTVFSFIIMNREPNYNV